MLALGALCATAASQLQRRAWHVDKWAIAAASYLVPWGAQRLPPNDVKMMSRVITKGGKGSRVYKSVHVFKINKISQSLELRLQSAQDLLVIKVKNWVWFEVILSCFHMLPYAISLPLVGSGPIWLSDLQCVGPLCVFLCSRSNISSICSQVMSSAWTSVEYQQSPGATIAVPEARTIQLWQHEFLGFQTSRM